MKILYITGYRYPSGLKEPLTSGDLRYSFTLSRALARQGHEVNIITRQSKVDGPKELVNGVFVTRYKSELSKIFNTSFDISPRRYRLFKKYLEQVDLVICNSPLSLEHFIKIKVPVIYIASGLEDVKNYSFSPKELVGFLAIKILRDPCKKLTWKKAKIVNTTAWYEKDTLLKWGIPNEKIGTISSSVDTSRFLPNEKGARKIREKLNIKTSEKIIISVSRFTPAKGILETIKGFELLKETAHLLIVGVEHSHDDTYFSKVLQAIKSSNKKKSIHLIKNVPENELPWYYSMADITTVFSKGYDPLPTVIIESMACGTPVVSTYYKTREQFIKDKESGIFVEELNIKDWENKVSELLKNGDLRSKISRNGLKKVRKEFDSDSIAKKYIEAIS